MTNNLLTVDQITRESLRILHQKATFLGSINKAYDSSFANEGAKIGDTLRIRLPNEYVVRTGATLNTQDTTETSVALQVATQKGVDLNFTAVDLTLDMEIFSQRIIAPAMSVLASSIESDALTSMTKDVYNAVDSDGSALAYKDFLDGGALMSDNLTPLDMRTALLSNTSQATIVNDVKGLFNDTSQIAKQYREGLMGTAAGFDWSSSSHVALHQTGSAAKTTGYAIDGADQTGSTMVIKTGTTTFLAGDIVTFVGVNRVHAETKVDSGVLQQFVVTADSGASATALAISPALDSGSTGSQNVSASPADGALIVKVGAGANETMTSDLTYHKDAFTFATADLQMPDGVDFAAREVFDGVSMRIIRDYDINNDKFPTRVDVLYGFKTIRAQMAARIISGT